MPNVMKKHIRFPFAAALIAAVFSLFSFTVWHHGWSNYDQTKPMNVTGEITEATYENPHGMIQLKDEDTTWEVVLAPPSRMQNRGLTKDMLKVGATATVLAYPHREHANEMRAERITVGDQTTELR